MIEIFTKNLLAKEQKLACLYDICLKTGAAGKDASNNYRDPKLLGHIYAAPYALFAPQYCLLWLDDSDGKIKGYCVAARDSALFLQKLDEDWWPNLRASYLKKSRQKWLATWSAAERELLQQNIMQPALQSVPEYFRDYPSHLHINLLPVCQGHGAGRKLIQAQLELLRQNGSCGVHLGLSRQNEGALAFYYKLGFRDLDTSSKDCLYLGLRL